MSLRTETTYEYYFNNASIYYCTSHDVLRVVNDHEDSVMLNGVNQKDINSFIEHYFEYGLDNKELKDYFVKSLRMKVLEEKTERLIKETTNAE